MKNDFTCFCGTKKLPSWKYCEVCTPAYKKKNHLCYSTELNGDVQLFIETDIWNSEAITSYQQFFTHFKNRPELKTLQAEWDSTKFKKSLL